MQVRLSPRRRLGTFRLGETVAHSTPSGFWGVYQHVVTQLDAEFQVIWAGEDGTFRACDRIFFAQMKVSGQDSFWGHDQDNPPSAFDWPGATDADREEAWRNANAWVGDDANPDCALYRVALMNVQNPLMDPSPGNPSERTMRAVISRDLFALHYVVSPNWSLDKLKAYVGRIRDRLIMANPLGRNLRNACLGWNLQDDTFGDNVQNDADVDTWKAVLEAAHGAQTDKDAQGNIRGVNLPFFFNWNIDGPGNAWQRTGSPPPAPREYLHYVMPDWMKRAIRKVSDDNGAFPDDSIRAPMPYFFPWMSNKWAKKSQDPPWFHWKQVIRALDEQFPYDGVVNGVYINRDLQVHPILEAGKEFVDSLLIPGHVDMHKQVRVLLDMEPKKRITSIWLAAWKVSPLDAPWYTTASEHWKDAGGTTTERWAEAVQNEIGDDVQQPTTEQIAGAQPSATQLRTDLMSGTASRAAEKWWIKCQLANAGRVVFEIWRTDVTPSVLAKTIDEGFTGLSPAGFYVREEFPANVGSLDEKLLATAVCWDVHKDSDQNPPPLADAGYYLLKMFVDGIQVDSYAFQVTGSL